jgi:outer membrane biosynthesis protein TonB/pSer/pThr/pTyr-binding forkhead associated (FHA) protein
MAFELRFQIPGQLPRTVPVDQKRMMIGTLPSNHVVMRAPGVDPIHALIEELEDGRWIVTDVGSETGVKVNGVLIDVESALNPGDKISFGSMIIEFAEQTQIVPPPPLAVSPGANVREAGPSSQAVGGSGVPNAPASAVSYKPSTPPNSASSTTTVRKDPPPQEVERRVQKNLLFSPRDARPQGDVLEVVAYWGDSVLDVELFHPTFKNTDVFSPLNPTHKDNDHVTIGVTPHAHFIAAGAEHFIKHTLVRFSSKGGYKLSLLKGMDTRVRRGGKVEKIDGEGRVSLDRRDIAHIKFGSVRYFMLFVSPPDIDVSRGGRRDPLFVWLTMAAMALYFLIVPALWLSKPVKDKEDEEEIFAYTEVPLEQKPPEPKPPEPKKPEIKVEEKKEPPKAPKPPPPKPKPVKPAKPVEKEKVQQPKPVEKPVEKPKPTESLQQKPTPPAPTPQKAQDDKAAGDPSKSKLSSLSKATAGMESTGAKKPDFKYAGEKNKRPLGAAGGPKGSGNNQTGGAIKGKANFSVQGVEGVKNNKASGVNLDKIGFGVGKILNKTGPGAIRTTFQSSAGGAGGGAGSGAKTYGMGGAGSGKSLGLAGAGGAANNFGSGSGGDGSGQGGRGGWGGSGGGPGFGTGGGQGGRGGRGKGVINIPTGDPSVSGGLTAQEIMAVIRSHLNEIRHCYEQLLQRSPNASGKISVNFTVGLSGAVSRVSVAEATLNDAVTRGCVTGRIQRWRFPKPRGGQPVEVNYPFVFNPL